MYKILKTGIYDAIILYMVFSTFCFAQASFSRLENLNKFEAFNSTESVPEITNITGQIEIASMPPNLNGGQFINQDYIRLIFEGFGTVTSGMPGFPYDGAYHDPNLPIVSGDVTFGNAITTPYNGPGLPSDGTEVYSIFLHFDPNLSGLPFNLNEGIAQSGTVTFDRPVIGAYVTSGSLNATDDIFTPNGVSFSNSIGRDMEFNYDGDAYLVSPDRYQLSLTMFIHNGGVLDEMRIILGADPPLPIELSSFTAVQNNGLINLYWQTKTEVNNFGFDIERSADKKNWNKIGFVNGSGNSNSPKDYSFTDQSLSGTSFYYRLKQIDNDGKYEYSNIIEVDITPTKFELSQNYPNPFNPATKIKYVLPEESNVVIKIFNILGTEVLTLINEKKQAGIYEAEFNAHSLPSGTYIYRITAGSYVAAKKMILLH